MISEENKEPNNINVLLCENCHSDNLVKKGFDTTKLGTKQRYKCKDCGACTNIYIEKTEMPDSVQTPKEPTDQDLIESNIKLARKAQLFQDSNRIERKSFREQTRIYNALSELNDKLISTIDKAKNIKYEIKQHQSSDNETIGILQLSDLHFGELISLKTNKYDFDVASKRLFKFVTQAIEYFKLHSISTILISLSGDIFNSNRRLDEILNQAASRANSLFIGVSLIEQVIAHLNQDFNVSVLSVVGNESRIEKDYNFANEMMCDNFDNMLFNILKYKYKDTKGINFILGDKTELVVDVCDNNFLFLHGTQISNESTQSVAKIKAKYAANGINVDYVIYGHLHQAYCSDLFSRSGSLCGGNVYSDRGLQLAGRASQNIYIVKPKHDITAIKIDLQDTYDIGYDIEDLKVEYESKSYQKLAYNNSETIVKIMI